MKHVVFSLMVSLAVALCLAPCVLSDTITFTNTPYLDGSGFGNVTNVLSLQAKHADNGVEAGGVAPPGDTLFGRATNTSHTWTAGQLTAFGFTAANLGIVFNVAEPGSSDTVNLESFSLNFYRSSSVPFGQAFLVDTPINNLISAGGQGTGTSGWLMAYHNTGLLSTFFSNPNNMLDGSGIVSDAAGGQDNFYLVSSASRLHPLRNPPPCCCLDSASLDWQGCGDLRSKYRLDRKKGRQGHLVLPFSSVM